jgi:hypothetical protein
MNDATADSPGYRALTVFVRDTLGCRCPDELLRRIRLCGGPPGIAAMVEVGGRLLIYVVDGRRLQPATVTDVAVAGCRVRDARGFNRFRLVLVDAGGGGVQRAALEAAFHAAASGDERAHLHSVSAEDLPSPLKDLLQPPA